MIALKIDPRIIAELSEGHKTIVITGTNGKTTTTHIVQQAVINTYGTAAYDPSSTNLEQGIATTLCLDSTVGGKRKSDWAVIECDEGSSKTILPAMHPQVMVVTNLYRDQVDRYTSWTTARDYIIKAAQELARDQARAQRRLPGDRLHRRRRGQQGHVVRRGVPRVRRGRGRLRRARGVHRLRRRARVLASHLCASGRLYLPQLRSHASCRRHRLHGHRQPREKSCTLTLRIDGVEHVVEANVRAGYDVYNAVAAVAGLLTTGMDAEDVFAALAHFTHAAHRFEIFDIDGTPTRLLLMKNTAGCNQLINMLVSEGELPQNLVCLLGAEIMDGITTDWIQDVRWEKLCADKPQVIVGGPKYEDMRDRLLRAGVPEENMRVQTDYAALVRDIAAIGEPVTVIANCSTIEALRLELVKKYQPLDYWRRRAAPSNARRL